MRNYSCSVFVLMCMSTNIYVFGQSPTVSPLLALSIPRANIINTVAGGGSSGDGGPATSAQLNQPRGVAVDSNGNIYIADYNNNVIRLVTKSTGFIITYVGNGAVGSSGDGGAATAATLNGPSGVALGLSGSLYIADSLNGKIRMVSSAGIITTFAGTGFTAANNFAGGSRGDGGAATSAQLWVPSGVAVDSNGNVYIADSQNNKIRKVNIAGIITTFAGTGLTYGGYGDGAAATSEVLNYPQGVAVDSNGNVYIVEDCRIRFVSSARIITTIAGKAGTVSCGDNGDGGVATSAQIAFSRGVTVDSNGNMYIAEYVLNKIRKVSSTGIITTYAGTGYGVSYGAGGSNGDGGAATFAQLFQPWGVAVDISGNVYIADTSNNKIRVVSLGCLGGTYSYLSGSQCTTAPPTPAPFKAVPIPTSAAVSTPALSNIITTYAGTGISVYGNGIGPFGHAATGTPLPAPWGVAVDSSNGNVYIGSSTDGRTSSALWLVTKSTGNITVFAGGGNGAGNTIGDGGAAANSVLNGCLGAAVDSSNGNVYIVDLGDYRIRLVTKSTGIITTFAGIGTGGEGAGDGGPAFSATFNYLIGVAVDSQNVYILDQQIHKVRVVSKSTGIITTFAGTGTAPTIVLGTGTAGSCGDGGPATLAQLNSPFGVAVDSQYVYIADTNNMRIRIVSKSTGIITNMAGNGYQGSSGDGGPATTAQLSWPNGVAVDSSGNIYIADNRNNKIRMVTTTGIINTLAGTGVQGFSGDGGLATSAKLYGPQGIAVDSTNGNVYIADTNNYRIRVVQRICPAGSYSGGSSCLLCAAGTYNPLTGTNIASACMTCPGSLISQIGASQCTTPPTTSPRSGSQRKATGVCTFQIICVLGIALLLLVSKDQ